MGIIRTHDKPEYRKQTQIGYLRLIARQNIVTIRYRFYPNDSNITEMNIDKELTAKFYDTFSPCDCDYCRYYIAQIEQEQPALCSFLRELSIDPLKPYELQSIYLPKEKKIDYLDCAYLVVGHKEDGLQKTINGICVSTQPANVLPQADVDNEYFYITFGSLTMHWDYSVLIDTSRPKQLDAIKRAIDAIDPIGLLSTGCPTDEYKQEAILLAQIINDDTIDRSITWKQIQEVFKQQFDEVVPPKVCINIQREIEKQQEAIEICDTLLHGKVAKHNITVKDGAVVLKVHDNFVVTDACGCIYINGKFYTDVEDCDLLDFYCDIATNGDRVYVQYFHKHFGFHYDHAFRYFKVFPKRIFALTKVRHFQDVELIFDNQHVIYSAPCLLPDLSEQQIIDDMYQQPVTAPHEKVFYSPDKRNRLVIYQENGIYSYETEQLTILDKEERNRCYAIWEPDWQRNTVKSLYDSLPRLLTDIAPLLDGWHEKE